MVHSEVIDQILWIILKLFLGVIHK
jgi:hypothetical protein